MARSAQSPLQRAAAVLKICWGTVPILAAILLGASRAEATVVAGTLYSPSNGRDIDYRVFVPPGYNPNSSTRYPVVFSLHGNGGTPAQRATTYSPTLTAKMNSGEIMPMIWVFPNGQRDSFYGDAFDGHEQVYSNIVQEMIPFIDANFNTMADRSHRAMEGFSMGGFGSGLYAAKHTELFSAALLLGGVLPTWADLLRKDPIVAAGMYNNQESNWLPYSIYDETAANAVTIAATVDYKQIIGDADGNMKGNLLFRDFLLSLGIDPQFQILPGVSHSGGLYLNEGSGLAFLNDHFLRASQAPVVLPGDYNQNGTVDGADFSVWRDRLDSSHALFNDDTLGVGPDDYTRWKTHFGESSGGAGSGATVAAPEPASLELFLGGVFLMIAWKKKGQNYSSAAGFCDWMCWIERHIHQ